MKPSTASALVLGAIVAAVAAMILGHISAIVARSAIL